MTIATTIIVIALATGQAAEMQERAARMNDANRNAQIQQRAVSAARHNAKIGKLREAAKRKTESDSESAAFLGSLFTFRLKAIREKLADYASQDPTPHQLADYEARLFAAAGSRPKSVAELDAIYAAGRNDTHDANGQKVAGVGKYHYSDAEVMRTWVPKWKAAVKAHKAADSRKLEPDGLPAIPSADDVVVGKVAAVKPDQWQRAPIDGGHGAIEWVGYGGKWFITPRDDGGYIVRAADGMKIEQVFPALVLAKDFCMTHEREKK